MRPRPFGMAVWFLVPMLALGCEDPPAKAPATEEPASLDPAAALLAAAGRTPIRFEIVSEASRIDRVNHSGRGGVKEFLVEAVGVGPACLDYDGDGLLDLYVPDGDVFENYDLVEQPGPAVRQRSVVLVPKTPRVEPHRDQLWRNRGDGTFEDVAEKAGVGDESWSFGATAFDYDGDGRTDIHVANLGHNRLYRNNGDGTFTDIAPKVGLSGSPVRWSTCAAPGDYDGDGRLDLYVGAYSDVAAEVENQRVQADLPADTPPSKIGGRTCRWKTIRAYCGPLGLDAQHDVLYRQQDDGTYRDVSEETSIRPREPKYAFQVLFFDMTEDGLMDIYVANDSVENYLFQQERGKDGRIQFREVADSLGVKYGGALTPQASMGATIGDANQDGLWDLFVTNFSLDYNNLYVGHRAAGGGFFFRDRGLQVMGQAVYFDLAWGCGWYDFDNDQDLDLYVANGHVYKEVDLYEKTQTTYDQHDALFECVDAPSLLYRELGSTAEIPKGSKASDLDAGPGMEVKKCSRGATFGDFDNDGFTDVFVQNMNEKPTFLRNTTAKSDARRWAKLRLRQPGHNRDALGASVEVEAAGKKQRYPVLATTSFLGSDDPRIAVGLGGAATFTVRVAWPPSGAGADEPKTTEFRDLEAGAYYVLDRATGKAERQPLPPVTRRP